MAEEHTIEVAKLGDIAAEAGLHRVSMLAWRDLDDPEAGGSELHASNIAKHWAEAGIEVNIRTSYAAGHPQVTWRDGYRVIRKAGRYLVFPRAAFSEMMGWHGGRDGLVEIWNGMPFFSPLWSRTAHVTWLHHVHAEMWQMTLPPRLAAFGNFVESKLAPPIYHRTPMVTLSESSKRELVHDLGFKPDANEIIAMKVQDITPEYVREMRAQGFDVDANELIAMKVQDITPEYRKRMESAGYKLDANQLIQAKVMGITPEFVQQAASHGFKNLEFHKLIQLKNADIF